MTDCVSDPVVFRNGVACGAVIVLAILGLWATLVAVLNHRRHQARERRRMLHETPKDQE